MLCNKIFENPRKGFLQLLDRGKNKVKKRIYFQPPTSLKLSFALGHGIFRFPGTPYCTYLPKIIASIIFLLNVTLMFLELLIGNLCEKVKSQQIFLKTAFFSTDILSQNF